MLFIDHDEWMRRTYSRISRRSPQLKKLDEELLKANSSSASDDEVRSWYTWDSQLTERGKTLLAVDTAVRRESIRLVQAAFNDWVRSRVDDWRLSGRNSEGAVTELYNQLVYYHSREPIPESERQAAEALRKGRDESIPGLFKGSYVQTKTGTIQKLKDKKTKASITKSVLVIEDAAHLHQRIAELVGDLVERAFGASLAHLQGQGGGGGGEHAALLASLMGEMKSLLADAAPIVGLVKNVGMVLKKSVDLYVQGNAYDDLFKVNQRLPEDSDPWAAVDSVKTWQKQDIARVTSSLARNMAGLGGQLATMFTAGGAYAANVGISVANAIVSITETISDLGIQYRGKNALNAYLNGLDLDRQIFAKSPLAGAYYLLNTPDSHIGLCFVNIGAPAWMEEYRILKNSGPIKSLITESERLIDASRYEILRMDGLAYRTREGKTTAVKVKEKVGMTPLRGKNKMEGFGSNGPVGNNA